MLRRIIGDARNSMVGRSRKCQETVFVLFSWHTKSSSAHSMRPHTTPSSSATNSLSDERATTHMTRSRLLNTLPLPSVSLPPHTHTPRDKGSTQRKWELIHHNSSVGCLFIICAWKVYFLTSWAHIVALMVVNFVSWKNDSMRKGRL